MNPIEQMLHAFNVQQIDNGVYPLNIEIRF
jgi:hypothetical protein